MRGIISLFDTFQSFMLGYKTAFDFTAFVPWSHAVLGLPGNLAVWFSGGQARCAILITRRRKAQGITEAENGLG
jgi:hypothetical protein